MCSASHVSGHFAEPRWKCLSSSEVTACNAMHLILGVRGQALLCDLLRVAIELLANPYSTGPPVENILLQNFFQLIVVEYIRPCECSFFRIRGKEDVAEDVSEHSLSITEYVLALTLLSAITLSASLLRSENILEGTLRALVEMRPY